jgi:hypothetical protein
MHIALIHHGNNLRCKVDRGQRLVSEFGPLHGRRTLSSQASDSPMQASDALVPRSRPPSARTLSGWVSAWRVRSCGPASDVRLGLSPGPTIGLRGASDPLHRTCPMCFSRLWSSLVQRRTPCAPRPRASPVRPVLRFG